MIRNPQNSIGNYLGPYIKLPGRPRATTSSSQILAFAKWREKAAEALSVRSRAIRAAQARQVRGGDEGVLAAELLQTPVRADSG